MTSSKKKPLFSVTIRDCQVEALASTGGAGGQRKNRRHTAIRLTHKASGAVGFSADHAHQWKNKQDAFRRMAESKAFRSWAKLEAARLNGKPSIEEEVERLMAPENIRVEVKGEDGKWQQSG